MGICPEKFDKYSKEEREFIIGHEAVHIAHKHFSLFRAVCFGAFCIGLKKYLKNGGFRLSIFAGTLFGANRLYGNMAERDADITAAELFGADKGIAFFRKRLEHEQKMLRKSVKEYADDSGAFELARKEGQVYSCSLLSKI